MYGMKTCTKCKETKDFTSFAKDKKRKDGLQPHCKACNASYRSQHRQKILQEHRIYYQKNKETLLAQKKQYYDEKHQEILDYKKEYYIENSEELVLKKREYRKLNPHIYGIWAGKNKHKIASYASKRRAIKLQATPTWLTKEQFAEIESYYLECNLISKATGIKHHVDHIIPLQGETVCGLHVPWNLQILSAEENIRKRNKLFE